MILSTLAALQINLGWQVALGIYLVIHIQRSILRITKVAIRIGIEYAFTQCFFITYLLAIHGPYLLTFLAVDDSRTSILTQRQLTFACHLCIAQECERYVFIIRARLWVTQDFSHLLVMTTTQHKTNIMECLLCHKGQSFWLYFEHLMSFKLTNGNIVLG